MTGLLIKVEHHPENETVCYTATMYRDVAPGPPEIVMASLGMGNTREEAIEDCKRAYHALEEKQPVEWLAYEPEVPEPQSLKA